MTLPGSTINMSIQSTADSSVTVTIKGSIYFDGKLVESIQKTENNQPFLELHTYLR
jgi:hypothetical protein